MSQNVCENKFLFMFMSYTLLNFKRFPDNIMYVIIQIYK